MKRIDSIAEETDYLFKEISKTILNIQTTVQSTPDTFEGSLEVIKKIRECAYENLNQLQHAALLLKAIPHLEDEFLTASKPISWYWHPYQTTGANEADLQARSFDGTILLSAEVTTSIKARGTISARMKKTLRQLQDMKISGDRYYIVSNENMKMAAQSFITKSQDTDAPLIIEVICLL